MKTWIVSRGLWACCIGVLLLCGGRVWGGEGLVLAEAQKSDYRIVVSADAGDVERYAAEELQEFLRQISGATLPIVTDAAALSAREILLGDNAHLRQVQADIDFSKLGDEGFTLRSEGERLIIAGRGRGVMYGVYTLLEDYLGCRWYSSSVSKIPTMETVRLPEMDDTQVPVLDYREVYYYDAMDPAFAGRLKLNGNASKKVNGRLASERHAEWATWCHTSFTFVPPDQYFESHPEYYAFSDGKRQAKQLCFTNPDLFGIVTDKIRDMKGPAFFTPGETRLTRADDGPVWAAKENTYIDFSQQDHYGACDCEACKAIDEREGSRMGSILTLVNQIAREFPDKTISTLSYVWSRTPPKHIRPEENVSIMLCNFEATRGTAMVDSPFGQDKAFMRDVERWSEICSQLFIWDYIVNFSHLYMPQPNLHVQQANIQFFVDHHAKGIFSQGSREQGGEFCELRNYLVAKLLWNPQADVDAIVDDFLDGYYGAAGRAIREYIDLMRQTVVEGKEKLGIYDPPKAHRNGYLSEAMVERYNAIFDRAENLVEGDETLLQRVRTARMPLLYVTVMNGYGEVESRMAALEEFLALCRRNGIKRLSEMGNPPDEFYTAQLEAMRRELGVSVTPHGGWFGEFAGVTATMATPQEGCEIRYTLDGTEPTQASSLYTGPVRIDGPCTVKARCFGGIEAATTSVAFRRAGLPLETGVMEKGEAADYVKVDVSGRKTLTLRVLDGNDSTNCDHGDWAQAKLIDAEGRVTWLSELKPVRSRQGWGRLGTDTNIEGNTLMIADVKYARGIGTHADSEIVYALDGRYRWFETYVGVDEAACDNASVVFRIEAE